MDNFDDIVLSSMEIFHQFGEDNQREKLVEECHELVKEPTDKAEIADVFLVALQFYLTDKEVQTWVKEKARRTLERIDEGYYG